MVIGSAMLALGCAADDAAWRHMQSHGQPDVIASTAGDMTRYYLADRQAPTWQNDQVVLYYLDTQQAVVFGPGQKHVRPISEDEMMLIGDLLEQPPREDKSSGE